MVRRASGGRRLATAAPASGVASEQEKNRRCVAGPDAWPKLALHWTTSYEHDADHKRSSKAKATYGSSVLAPKARFREGRRALSTINLSPRLPASAWPRQRARGGPVSATRRRQNGYDDDHTPNNVDEFVTASAACSLRSSCAARLGTALTLAYGRAR
jgi:hypothetical protein